MKRSYYQSSIDEFLKEDTKSIFGQLATNNQYDLGDLQKNAWIKQIDILKSSLEEFSGRIFFEFEIPRMGKRADNILIINNVIFVVEFKVGANSFPHAAKNQTIDYCNDLLNFHEGSNSKTIIPILVSTNAPQIKSNLEEALRLKECILCNSENLKYSISKIISEINVGNQLDELKWMHSAYRPTPTIIEAAQALYKGHNVKDISRSDSGAINLSKTTEVVNKIIENSKANNRKSICFITGVPGAGKTLAGLNIANSRLKADESEHSVFLSGNGPLVNVLREALTRDSVLTAKEKGVRISRSSAEREAKAFIQNIHHFRDDNLKTSEAPIEKVVVFDESQRAWNQSQLSKFMKNKKGIEEFNISEPDYLISVMNRHKGWCSIVCLIGGGQEINTGEGGVSEWIESLRLNYSDWDIYYSDQILTKQSTYLNDERLLDWLEQNGLQEPDLHLSVSVRSFRSEKVALYIENIINNNIYEASRIFNTIKNDYPIYLTRSIDTAKKWLREQAKGTERFGIIASSGGRRLRVHGIDVKNSISPSDWFLNDKFDVRSSYYMETIASEFDIQGLEIDYACLAWDINLYYDDGHWNFQDFRGSKWQKIKQNEARVHLLNAYRVLLTRARQGMVIFIPEVDNSDWTRPKEKYDSTFKYLQDCGIMVL